MATNLIRPLLRYPFPGRWKIFAATINNNTVANMWDRAGLRWTRDKTNGYLIPCDLSVFSGRIAWFFRRWYEIDTQSVLRTVLPSGGNFVDIGANIGMASLTARKAIGDGGRILAFEPQPKIASIFREGMRRNGIGNAELINAAICEAPGTIPFFSPDINHGEGRIGDQPDDRPGQHLEVDAVDGSRLDELDRIDAIKIDVEGYELTVLQTIDNALSRFRPIIVCEVMGEHLLRAKTRPQHILNYFEERGYSAFSIATENDGLFRQRAVIEPLPSAADDISCNALFVPNERADDLRRARFVSLPK